MTLRARRAVYLSFVACFLVAAPLLILYARGYRYDAADGGLEATGTLVVSTVPRGATVSLNGAALRAVTPATLTAVPPQTYLVQLTREGYRPWQKRLPVRPDGALFVSNVHLWRSALPVEVATGSYQRFSPSPDGQTILLTSWREKAERFWRFDVATEELTLIAERTIRREPTREISWSPAGDRALVIGDDVGLITVVNPPTFRALPAALADRFRGWRWDDINPDAVYVTDGAASYQVDLATATAGRLSPLSAAGTDERILDLWVADSRRYELIARSGEPTVLRISPLAEAVMLRELSLPGANPDAFLELRDNLVALRDTTKVMTLWRLLDDTVLPLLTAPNVTGVAVTPKTGELLYTTPFEVWTYNPTTNERQLLTRVATALGQPAWYPDASHVAFAADRSLIMMERDERDVRNQWTLASFNQLAGYSLDPGGERLYLAGTIGRRPGLFRIDL